MAQVRNIQRIVLLAFVSIAMTGCERQPAATVSPNYDSASDRYATSDLNGPSASAVPAPDMEPDVAAASAPGDGSGTAAPESSDPADSPPSNTPESRGAVNASSDITNSDERSNSPMAARIAELEEIVADLQAQLDDSRHRRGPADTNQGATRQANATRVAAPAPAMPEPDVARVQATPARNGITASGNRYARLDLDRLIRRYKRARVEVAKSQASYEIDHLMAMIKAGEFLVRDTPISFNQLPELAKYPFQKFQEAADDLVPELELYLEDLASDEERNELQPLLDEAHQVIDMEPPGTGNTLLDFIQKFTEVLERNQSHQQ